MRNRFGVVVGVLVPLSWSPLSFRCPRLVGVAVPSLGSSVGGVALGALSPSGVFAWPVCCSRWWVGYAFFCCSSCCRVRSLRSCSSFEWAWGVVCVGHLSPCCLGRCFVSWLGRLVSVFLGLSFGWPLVLLSFGPLSV